MIQFKVGRYSFHRHSADNVSSIDYFQTILHYEECTIKFLKKGFTGHEIGLYLSIDT